MSVNVTILTIPIPKLVILDISCHSWQFWKDEYLKWEPAKFSGIENFVVAATLAWLPDFALINR